MRTNEQIFAEIRATGIISKKDMQLLKNRSNKAGKDLMDYDIIDAGEVRLTPAQGAQGLAWLRKFIRKDGTSRLYGHRELEIVNTSTCDDFIFRGFYDAGRGYCNFFLPIYEVGGMEYIPMKEPYIVG